MYIIIPITPITLLSFTQCDAYRSYVAVAVSPMLSAAFATLLVDRDKEGKDIQQILAVAAAIAANELQKEKYSSKKSNKLPKKTSKAAK